MLTIIFTEKEVRIGRRVFREERGEGYIFHIKASSERGTYTLWTSKGYRDDIRVIGYFPIANTILISGEGKMLL